MGLLDFLGWGAGPAGPAEHGETETVRRIVRGLQELDPERARFVAAFSYILSRVAFADMRITDAETEAMERIVADQGGLPAEQAVIVVQMARQQNELFGGTENYLVTRELNRLATPDEKRKLLRCLFAVSAADETITTVEDNVIRQVARELRLDHKDFIAARSGFREQLGVLREPED